MAITCRAKVSPQCWRDNVEECYPAGEDPQDDGTFDPKTDSLVCDPCYVLLIHYSPSGQALNEELTEEFFNAVRQSMTGNTFT